MELSFPRARSTSCPAEQIRFPTLERVTDEEFTLLSRASYNSPRAIWSDGAVIYVADESDDTVCSSNMPDAIDARLAEPARRRLRRVRRRPDGVRGIPRGWRDGDNRRTGGGSGPRKRGPHRGAAFHVLRHHWTPPPDEGA